MSIPFGGPYPYIVTVEITYRRDGLKTIAPIPVIAYNPVDAMQMASINGQGSGSLPTGEMLRAIKVEPDYTYVQKPSPDIGVMRTTEAIIRAAMDAFTKKQPHGADDKGNHD